MTRMEGNGRKLEGKWRESGRTCRENYQEIDLI
jgi:hypothetical protein